MGKRPINILLIGDDLACTEMMERTTGETTNFHLTLEKAQSINKGLKRLSKTGIDGILLDLSIKGNKGLETLGEVHDAAEDLPIVVISSAVDEITALKASKKGASDYLHKEGLTPDLLARSLSCTFFKTKIDETIKKAREDSKRLVEERAEEIRKICEQMMAELIEHKRVEKELTESEEKYRILVENANDGIVILQDGFIKYINQRFIMITGHKAEEVIDTSFIGYIYPDEVEKVLDRYKRRMAGEDVTPIYESAISHKDGHKVDVEFNASTFSFKDKPAILAIVRDITMRKKAEEAIKESDEKWRNLFENSIEAAFTVDIRGNLTSINEAFASIMGYEREEIIGSNFSKYVKPETSEYIFNAYNHLYRTGEPIRDLLYEIVIKDGKVRAVEGYINVIREGDKITGFQGTLRDITERKRAEESLRESEKKIRDIFETSKDVIYISTTEGKFININSAAEELLGYTMDELLKLDIGDIYSTPEDREKFQRDIEKKGFVKDYEITFKKKDGTPIDCLLTSTLRRDKNGNILGYQGIIDDITEKKRMENLLKESEEKFHSLFENAADSIVLFDAETGEMDEFNDRACESLGYTREEFKKLKIPDYEVIESVEDVTKHIEKIVNEGEGIFETKHRRKNGEIRDIFVSARNISIRGRNFIQGIWRDITELKRSEEALKESKERYRNLVENLNDVIFNIDMEGNLTYMSPAIERISKYSAEEITGKSFAIFTYPEDIPMLKEVFMHDVTDMEKTYEFRVLNKNGEIRHVRTSARAQFEEGKPVGMIGIMTDITEQKQTEEALINEKESAQRYLDIAGVILVALDNKGNITLLNKKGQTIFGYKEGELLGKNWFDTCIPETARNDVMSIFQKFISREADKFEYFENPILTKSGTERIIAWYNTPLSDGKNNVTGTLSSGEDITDRKKAEESLRESEEKFRSLFETSKDVVYLSSIDGRFIEINTAGEELFGYTRDELLSIDIQNLYINHDNRKKFQRRIEKEGFVKDYEITFKRKNGTIIDSLSTAAVIRDGEGNIIGYQGIIRDITEWKKIEAQLIRTEKLSSLGEIVSGVAHELNNPLTSIIGNAQLLMRKDISTDVKNKAKSIERESIRCSKIVRGLLTFAREHKPERRMVNLNDVINTSLNLMEYELRVNNVFLELDLSVDIPETSADPYQLQQVFINLINNTQDALVENGGGSLIISTFHKNDNIIIEFEDNGPGIPKENLRRIFDPFFTTKEVGEGTGLGLSIVFGIINEHGGRIDVESEVGKGTKFRIEIPVTTGVIRDEYIISSKPKRPDGVVSILVIDDEESLRNYMSEILSLEGYVIKTCDRGEEAIELLKTNEYDAIISDIKMPGMNGQDVYTSISKKNPELAKKILFITGDILGKNTQKFLKTTNCKFVEKPFDIDVLLSRLNEILSA